MSVPCLAADPVFLREEVLDVLRCVYFERPYAIRPLNTALVTAVERGLVRRIHREACVHKVGAHLELWKDLALTDEGVAVLLDSMLGP
jgi:hypothetical protein